MRGDLGQIEGGFNAKVQDLVLKGEQPYTDRPNSHLEPIDWPEAKREYTEKFGSQPDDKSLLAYLLYPNVYADYHAFDEDYGPGCQLTYHRLLLRPAAQRRGAGTP